MADMTPIERAARAVRDTLAVETVFDDGSFLVSPRLHDSDLHDIARAVIAALREPSEEMLLALRTQIQNVSDREDEVWNFVFDTLMAD